MIRSLLLAGLVGGASATLTNTTRQTLLADRLTNQSLGSGEYCSALGRHCNQNHNNCNNNRNGSSSCYGLSPEPWLCGSESTCCVPDGGFLYSDFNAPTFAHFCDGASAVGDYGTNDYCCSGQCCYLGAGPIVGPDAGKLGYRCGTDC